MKDEVVERIQVSDSVEIKIYRDEDPLDPRKKFDNTGTIYSNHRQYSPDDHSIDELGDSMSDIIKNLDKNYIWLNVYAYIHSGITVRAAPFNDPWDSGLFGIIAIPKSRVLKEYGVKRISKKLADKIRDVLKGEVQTLDDYYNDEVYGYVIEQDGEEVESCWGYYGLQWCKDSAKEAADGYAA